MSSAILLSVILFQVARGTFPPVSNPPPIPGQSVRTLDISPQQFYIQEDLPQEPPPLPNDGLFPDNNSENQRWYVQENHPSPIGEVPSSMEGFDRFYLNGEPAVGPVATPMPDDSYVAQPSSISKANPRELSNSDSSDIWILTRGDDNQYTPERWMPVQMPSERMVEFINQESNPSFATDTVKSIAAPLPIQAPVKTQYTPTAPENIVQQIWIRSPSVDGTQKVYSNAATVVQNGPSVKQIIDIPPSVKQIVQQQYTKDSLPIPPPPVPVVSKKSFSVPPPLPPPVKGLDISAKVVPSAPVYGVPENNIVVSGKNGLLQQVRHVWIPTSSRTGRFISIAVSNTDSGKSLVNRGIQLDSTPIDVSDTWVLKQEGPIPSLKQQKSLIPPPNIQSGKVIYQDPSTIQLNSVPNPVLVSQVDTPAIIGKSISPPSDIWPIRNDLPSPKVLDKSAIVPNPEFPVSTPKSGAVIVGNSVPFPSAPQKTIKSDSKLPPILPQFAQHSVSIVNGKPCPIPPQNILFPPKTQTLLSVPRIIATQRRQPFSRIIRVNRYPTGSYYVLNSGVQPRILSTPHTAFIQQPKSGLLRLIQTKQIPVPLQNKQPAIPVQTRHISIPVQSKAITPLQPTRQLAFSVPTRQVVVPVPSLPNGNRLFYPLVQPLRYAYPYGYSKLSPVPGKSVLYPQYSPLKVASLKLNSASSSSESSSSESSSESISKEGKKEKERKKERHEEKREHKEEKPQSEESGESKEKEKIKKKEIKSEESEKEKESEETEEDSGSKESIAVAESQVSQQALENSPTFTNPNALGFASKPYVYRFDNRDSNGTMQYLQEASDTEGRLTGSYGNYDSEGLYKLAKYVTDSEGYRVKIDTNEPGTVTQESGHANKVSDTEDKSQTKSGSTENVLTDLQLE